MAEIQAAHSQNHIRLGIVLVGWCPPADDGPDGKEPVRVVVGTGEQPESCSPPIR